MTKYTTIECNGCGELQTNIVDDMEYTFMEFIRGPTAPDGYRPRHVCDNCALEVYDTIRKRRDQESKFKPGQKENRVSTIR